MLINLSFARTLALAAIFCAVGGVAQAQHQVTRAQYQAALSQTASAMAADMDRSHECFVRTAFYSQLFQSGMGEATDRANRRLYETVADAFRLRINNLLAAGQTIPDAYAWVGPAMFDQQPDAQRTAADWFRRDQEQPDFDRRAQACAGDVMNAAGAANAGVFRARSLMTTDPQ